MKQCLAGRIRHRRDRQRQKERKEEGKTLKRMRKTVKVRGGREKSGEESPEMSGQKGAKKKVCIYLGRKIQDKAK